MDEALRGFQRIIRERGYLDEREYRAYERGILSALRDPEDTDSVNAWVDDLKRPYAKLTNDDALEAALLVCLPNYEGKREDVVVGLGNLEGGRKDHIKNWLSLYVATRPNLMTINDGVIVTPLRLEIAVAIGMDSICEVSLFRPEVDAYRQSFQESIEKRWPAYGWLTYGTGTSASLDELTLDVAWVRRRVDAPVLRDDLVVLAPEQEEGASEVCAVPEVEACLKTLTGYKNPAGVLQSWASRTNQKKRETRLWIPSQSGREDQWTLLLGRNTYGFGIGAVSDHRPARGCRRAKNFP